MIQTLKAVIRKEWRDSVRDRRSISASILFAISGPLLIALLIANQADEATSNEPIRVDIVGAEVASDLMANLHKGGVELAEGAEPAPVQLTIPTDYAETFEAGEVVWLEVTADRSKSGARRDAERLERLIQGYSASLGQMRLALRGVAPSVAQPIAVESRDLATREARSSHILGLLTIYFLIAAFFGSMAVSIDVAAGERERNSLEVLMAQPISALAVFAGKTVVASLFGAFGIGMTILVSKLVFVRVPLDEIGLSFTIGWLDAGLILVSLLPLAVMVAALQILLSLWAKTFKEASTYLNALMFLPMAVAMVVQVKEVEPAAWMFSVPLLGHQQWIRGMIRAETVEPALMGLLTLSTLAVAAALIWLGSTMLGKERIVFGQSD